MAFTKPKASQVNFDTTNISDSLIRINSGETEANTKDMGLIFERGSNTNAALIWDESETTFKIISTTSNASETTSDINISGYHNFQAAEVSGSILKVTGAYALPAVDGSYGQVIGTDGSGNTAWISAGAGGAITISDVTDLQTSLDAKATGSDITTAINNLVNGASAAFDTLKEIQDAMATDAELSAAIAAITTVQNANQLTTSRSIALGGVLSGSVSFNGTADATITASHTSSPTLTIDGDVTGAATFTSLGNTTLTATIAANSVALGTDTTGNYVAAGAVAGVGLSGSSSSEGGTFTVTSNATSANTGSTIVARDAGGNFTAGIITALATSARYADLAEKYQADNSYTAGDVLVFGGIAEVTLSKNDADIRIAGVVSTDPAYLMNSAMDSNFTVAVALMGRVPCKVIGRVHKGDLIVSSNYPGVAKAWRGAGSPAAGSIIGKSIEDKDSSGHGVIEIAVGIR